MKKTVLYESGTGFTEQYAKWIAQELSCEAKPLKKSKPDGELVIFGGWVMGGTIIGLNKLQKIYSGKLVVFAVGVTPADDALLGRLKKQNGLENTPFFYLPGGMRMDKLGFVKKKMISIVKGSLAKKQDKTDEEVMMMNTLGTNFDNSDRKYIADIVEFCR